MKVEFFRHSLGEREVARIREVLQEPILTTGRFVAEFEQRFSAYLGAPHTIGVTSCTAALHLALLALGIGPGDEVIVPAMTFVATANAVIHAGAKPVFVDAELSTGNLDASLVEAAITPATRAIIPVHLYGQMCDMRHLRDIADRRGLAIVEDCAHCIEGVRDGVRPGQLSDAACFSFYATKNITCGEGGAVVTQHAHLNERIRCLRLHGMSKGAADRYKRFEHWDVAELGWKYNMDNLQGALLLDQIGEMDERRGLRESLCQRYEQALGGVPGIDLHRVVEGSLSARHLFTILVDPERRDTMIADLQDRGIGVAVNYRPVHLLRYYVETYGYAPGSYPVAEHIGQRTLSLPLYPGLPQAEQDYVIETVKQVVGAAAHA